MSPIFAATKFEYRGSCARYFDVGSFKHQTQKSFWCYS